MRLLIDTSSDDLLILLFNEQNQVLGTSHAVSLLRKSEVLVSSIAKVLGAANVSISEVKRIYVTQGPGSFMGARSGLLFAVTFCLLTSAELWIAPTFALLKPLRAGAFFIKASKEASYGYWREKGRELHAIVKSAPSQLIDYAHLLSNIDVYLSRFTHEPDVLAAVTLYYRRPQIGAP